MKIVFASNFFNHHQKPFSDEMYKLIGDGYRFIESIPMDEERKNMGWTIDYPSYVMKMFENKDVCQQLIDSADIVITGDAPESCLNYRKINRKVIVRYCERPLKHGLEPLKYFPRLIKWHLYNPFFDPIYMLCSSAYTASDYGKFALFNGKTYKWAYFTALKTYDDVCKLIESKKKHSILWVARFLKWKHPEYVVALAKWLKELNYEFEINMIGPGEEFDSIKNMIEAESLNEYIHLLGSMTPEQVRTHMEKSEIFVFTSDQNEGWGAVVNESMNSACAVVADSRIGSIPFLIKSGENGFAYSGLEEFKSHVRQLLDDDELRKKLSLNAYNTILNAWSPKIAAERCLKLCSELLCSGACDLFSDGPCSRA